MNTTRLGIEIEMTGLTRKEAAEAAKATIGGELLYGGTYYDTWILKAPDSREWKLSVIN